MSDIQVYFAFIVGSLLLYTPSYYFKKTFSGNKFRTTGAIASWCYNVCIGAMHAHVLEKSIIPFYGYFDNWLLGWLSLAMIFVHAYAIPRRSE